MGKWNSFNGFLDLSRVLRSLEIPRTLLSDFDSLRSSGSEGHWRMSTRSNLSREQIGEQIIFTTRVCGLKQLDAMFHSYSVQVWVVDPVGHRKLLKEAARDAIEVLGVKHLGMAKRGIFRQSCGSSVFSRFQ